MENQGLIMLDQALELAEQEMSAVLNEDYEDAIELSRQRGVITTQAWDYLETDVRDEYRARLLQLNEIHKRLTKAASEAHARMEATLRTNKKERRRMLGYQMAVTQALQ
ncbi:MAG: hypothetical protein IJS50_04855 [Desulfovibrio sp.]|nr:hypothetical protein [Desulfovibrio sp.]